MMVWLRALTVGLLSAMCLPANAGVITLDFNSGYGIYLYEPYYEDGFRVRPVAWPLASEPGHFVENHFDLTCDSGNGTCPGWTGPGSAAGYDGTTFLGTDVTGCRVIDADGSVVRVGIVGCPKTHQIRIDFYGRLFNALDFEDLVGVLTSSKGGSAGGVVGPVSLTGELWRNIEWIDLSDNFGFGAPIGIDNLRVVPLPEPSSLALLGLGLAGLALTRHRKS